MNNIEIPSYERGLLVVDDEMEIIKSLRRQFMRTFKVYIANSAAEGLEILKSNSIQVIISDQRMPEMTGSEFFAKAKERYPDAMRLLLTGYADINAVIQAINDGNIFRYVMKPWNPVELDTIVQEAFEKYELIIQNRFLVEQLANQNAQLEDRVLVRTKEVEDANSLKDKFVSLVAHDLRGPLAAIINSLEQLTASRQSETLDQNSNTIISSLIDTGNNMLHMVETLLNINRLKTGKIQLSISFFSAHAMVDRVITNYGLSAKQKGITIENRLSPADQMYGDTTLLGEVVGNFVSNAIKFCHSGDTILIDYEREGENSRLTVEDSGTGISKEAIQTLFKIEEKTSTIGTLGEKGTGFGLPYCMDLVNAHKGEIQVTSTVGEGSRFSLILALPKPTILLASQSESSQAAIQACATSLDAHLVMVKTLQDVRVWLAENRMNLLIVEDNVVEENLTSFESLNPKGGEVRTIILTSSDDFDVRLFSLGAYDFITQPTDKKELLARVTHLVG
ncbi:MAG: response regulator [Magnetococcales bacterium]|nr:response regulator [Magnetococcales bacterium]